MNKNLADIRLRLSAAIEAMVDRHKDALSMTQADVADMLGLHRPDLSRICNHRVENHSVQKLIAIARSLGCSVDVVINLPDGDIEQNEDEEDIFQRVTIKPR